MPATRQELFNRFEKLKIVTHTVEHQPVATVELAKSVHADLPGGHCKNLFCKDDKGALWLLVALEDARIDLKKVPALIGSRRLSFGKPELLMEVLGVEPGSVTPFALINDTAQRCTVILDEDMMRHDPLNYHPLFNTATTAISPDNLITFIRDCGHKPRIVPISDPM